MTEIQKIEVKGIRVLTSAQIAECYECKLDRIKQNFRENKDKFIEGKHYIAVTGDELRKFKNEVGKSYLVCDAGENEVGTSHLVCDRTKKEVGNSYLVCDRVKNEVGNSHSVCEKVNREVENPSVANKVKRQFDTQFKYAKMIYLWTEKGALLHAKSLNTDKAWEVYDYLVDFYFRTKEHQEKRAEEPKPQGKQVVDIPVNRKAQDMMTELRKNMAALDVLLGTLDRYSPEEDYQKVVYVIRQQGMNIANLSINLATIKPSMIYKVY